ncbi:basement membrane-specific heparan sulfate proteoglycan core protein isoform X5 [Drosophila hydei]|uniref:Basement membrane-specific heparan sulfate proteoglycan core protein isoform X5 n=1 Tax=Drosophila hydei TaxID=7224 RepID=A0A6J2SVD6_DROHY|nr:basement membrane-specific heparan sulfate proteoglycan core protein isoform X5 [Drosophila hydei]
MARLLQPLVASWLLWALLGAALIAGHGTEARGWNYRECSATEYRCRNGKCIDNSKVCNYVVDCPDGEDEGDDCPAACSGMEYQCRDGTRCISVSQQCDGHADCSDGDDEEQCDGSGYDADQCLFNEFRCRNGECIPMRQVCDNIYDCNDYTDEQDCDPNEIENNRDADTVDRDGIIRNYGDHHRRPPPAIGRDNDNDNNIYEHGLHELDLNEYELYNPQDHYAKATPQHPCDANHFKCQNNVCIPIHLRCDGYHHCNDRSDEADCDRYRPPTTTRRPVTFAPTSYFWTTAAPGSLERQTTNAPPFDRVTAPATRPTTNPIPITTSGVASSSSCAINQIACNGACLDWSLRCDGILDCDNGIDELNCPAGKKNFRNTTTVRKCQPNQWQCSNSECINADLLCDKHADCTDESDELPSRCLGQATDRLTAGDCRRDQFFCDESCFDRSILCDGNIDCIDRSDERDCHLHTTRHPLYPPLPCPQHTCPSGRCYTESERCDGRRHCEDSSDEANCCAADQFRCRDGNCVSQDDVCNGFRQCMDGSDEENCDIMQCQHNQFRCRNGQCVSLTARCNGKTDCQDSSDESNCASDPSPPGRNQLNLKTYPDSQIIKERYIREGREVIFRCRDEGPARAKVRWTRPGGRALPVGFTDKGGRLEIPNIRVEDSGTYVCEAVGYPSYIQGQQVTVHLTVERFNIDEHERPPTACTEYQATCMNSECIDKSEICDGVPNCSDGSDEHRCSHGRRCQPNQFLCRNTKCVERTWRCDGEDDCGDNSDEESCDPEPSGAPCRYDEFQCSTGHCVPKSFHCDGINDCRDGSDEFGCTEPKPLRKPPPMQSLLEGQSLNLTCTGTGVPIPTIIWRLNWGHVPDQCKFTSSNGRGDLYCPNMQYKDSGAYSCEIMNARGTIFVTPDTIVKVTPDRNQFCEAGFFNMLARSTDECIKCFCFGVANSCESANLFTYAIQPPILSHRVVTVDLTPYQQIVINEGSGHSLLTLHHGVQFRASDVQYNSRETPYLALPSDYMGNQLKSYGGELRYEVNYMGNGRPVSGPDAIITGNGFILTNRVRTQPNQLNKVKISFLPGNWQKPDGRKATREEIMMILANVDNILIRLGYIDTVAREVELTNIAMDSAGSSDQGLGSASLVEKCNCPPGYIGDSCESCAPGFVRQPGGPWLGRCVPFVPELCPAGTFGDPRRGVPCSDCPCPHTGSNNFANGCKLSPDNDVICNCHEGYEGRRCESCAAGYQGNPLIPGGACHKTPESTCNVEGTYNQYPDGSCHCKALVTGDRCDTCAQNSFHLNSFTYSGCIECFCSGLQAECTSTSWFREQVSSSFGHSHVPHGFQLVRDYTVVTPQSVPFDTLSNEISFKSGSEYSADTLYWSLPAPFLGNKLTAYGGRLNYTLSYSPLPGGQMSRNSAPDVVIKSGEDLTLIHFRKAAVSPSTSNSYAVPIIESAWQRTDGEGANREHLLMALSKIDAIYIKATYTTGTMEGSLKQVVMDIANSNSYGTQRALEVEECRCPQGYIGLSCERCAPGYKRNLEGGLYLGLCEPCECNGHSTQCDAESGECLSCSDNTEGENCDRCAAGYVGDATRGTPYDCQPDNNGPQPPQPPQPSPDDQRECQWCNRDGTEDCRNGVCYCRRNVVGARCDQCRPNTFGLSPTNPDGCKDCFCSGHSSQCRSAVAYRQLIAIDFISNKALITDEYGQQMEMDDTNLKVDIPNNMYTYSYPSYSIKYWSLRGNVQGNQLHAYGGHLKYTLDAESFGDFLPGNDVVLIGNGVRLVWSRPPKDAQLNEYSVRLSEEEQWLRLDSGSAVPASRHDIMSVLVNIEHLLIRATPKIPTKRTSISDVTWELSLDTNQPGAELVTDIELCQCPAGYTGNSCENCALLNYREENGQCRSCPCQEENTQSCYLGGSGYVECKCKPNFKGDRCQDFDYGIPVSTTTEQPDNIRTQIIVSISKPQITIMPVGGSISLHCNGRMKWNNNPVLVSWYKQNSQLPNTAEISGGVLNLYNMQLIDSGVYICRAVNNQTSRAYEDMVSLTITTHAQRSPAQIVNLPQTVTFDEYVVNEINCEVEGNPTPIVTWTRIDGQADGHTRTDGSRLIFESPRKSDEGRYRCQAQNDLNIDEKYVQVYVLGNAPQPQPPARERLYIQPENYNGEAGDLIRFVCQSTSGAQLHYEWLHDGYPLNGQQQSNVIISGDTLEIRDATTRDNGVYTCVGNDLRTHRNYTEDARVYIEDRQQPIGNGNPPRIVRLEAEHVIYQGTDLSITCESSGSPYPSIKWMKVRDSMPSNVQITGNVLRIHNAMIENRGWYVCTAENAHGTDQSNTHIDIEPRERPSVEIEPVRTLTVGEQGILFCRVHGIPEPTVQWRRVDDAPLSSRHVEQAKGYIVINEIQVADGGDYECSAENTVGRTTAVVTLRVIDPPVIQLDPSESLLPYTEGDEVRIACVASGTPNPTVQWDNQPAVMPLDTRQIGSNTAYLIINRVTQADAKVYVCKATNEAGDDERTIRIDVKPKRGDIGDRDGDVERDPYLPPYYHQSQRPSSDTIQRFTANLGDNVTLTCNLDPYLNTEWTRVDGQPLLPNAHSEHNKLTITFVEEHNLGQYRCNAMDHRGALVTYVVRELVRMPLPQITFRPNIPLEVEANRNVEIYCDVTGARPEDVQWATDNNRPLPSSVHIEGQLLRFIAITPADAGGYSCTASNEYGNISKIAQVVVRPPATYTQQPISMQQQRREGESIQMRCTVTTQRGEQRVNTQFNWYREDGQPLPNNARSDSQILILTSLRLEDAGRYICDSYDINTRQRSPPTYVDLSVQQNNYSLYRGGQDFPCVVLYICADFKLNKLTPAKPLATPPRVPTPSTYACQATDFKCVSHPHTCIKASMVCDGIYDCTDHSDEFNCSRELAGKAMGRAPTGGVGVGVGVGVSVVHGMGTTTGPGNSFKRWKKSWKRQQPWQQADRGHRKDKQQRVGQPKAKGFFAGQPGAYLPPSRPTPPPEPVVPRDYSLKLDQQSSKLHVGESTEVECYSSDNSYTDVIWERSDGVPLSANIQQVGNRLVITEVTAADAGNYVCKCRTDNGDLYTTSYELAIEEQPHELRRPKIVHANVGDQAQLSCGADESRQPSYRWSRQYGQMQSGRDILSNELSLQGVQASDAGSYICTAVYNDGESVDYPSILVITGVIPQFSQQPLSYMSFPTLPDSSFNFNFEITFRPESANGVLLFNGQTRGAGDYIALSLKDRYVEFRFDFGGKPMVVRAEQPLELNEWHTARVQRSRRDGYIQLDEQHPVAFPTLTQIPQLELIEDLYIGGVPSWEQLPAEAVAEQTGFVGCISRLTLQGRTIELMKDAKLKEGITSCKPCAASPCANGGICLESQTELAYTCVCQQGWTGRNCAVEGTQCTPGLCGAGRCENTELDMECLCPLNRTGDRCQYMEHLNEHSLNFKRNSYAAYNTPRVSRINVTLSLRPASLRDAVLLYTAESKLPSGDYVALVLRDGHVELIINTAARLKPVVVRSQKPLPLHRWTRVELLRRQGESILRVGDEPEQRAKAAGAPRTLSLKTPLYVGGYDRATVKINRDVNINEGFDGCISRLYDSMRPIQLLAAVKDAANVQNCGELNEIGDNDFDGELPVVPVAPTSDTRASHHEEEQQPYAMSPCANEPCENGGTCREVEQQAICACSLGYSGKHCEEHIQVSFNASFRGNGYLEVDRSQFSSEIDQQYTSAVVVFSTNKPNGLLLWWGQKSGEEFTGQDFIALAVVDGLVEYALRLDGEEVVIRNVDTPVDDGQRHIVLVKRADNTAILEVDRISDSGETRPTSKKEMHLPGNVFIGGIPNISNFTGKRYSHNFNGCIVFVEGDAVGQINLGKASVSGVNVDTCPVNDEALGGTEPPVV